MSKASSWKEVLEQVIVTVQTLAEQSLALIGHGESIINDPNPGNFLALLKYLAKFVPYHEISFGFSLS